MPYRSAVAGIVDANGGLRVVITQPWLFRNHLLKDERLFVLPRVLVREPVSLGEAAFLISKVEQYVLQKLAPINHCGECRQCCITLYIPDHGDGFSKPSDQPCGHCSVASGCKIHWKKPDVCRTFECLWLKSQSRNDVMPPELRPDRCGAIFTEDTINHDPELFECHFHKITDVAKQFIAEQERIGRKAKIITFYEGEKKP